MDQLVEIIKVVGNPTQEDILSMNPDSKPNSIKLPNVKPIELKNVTVFMQAIEGQVRRVNRRISQLTFRLQP